MREQVRAFLALLLPEEMILAAAEVQEQLRPRFPEGAVKWVESENFHLTLRFFGDLDRKRRERAEEVVAGLDRGFGSVPVAIAGVSAFPGAARPQTIWLALDDGQGALDALAAEIDRRVRGAGFGPADKPWKSHLTLGRVRRDRKLRVEPSWTAGLTWGSGKSTIRSIALMQSELRPQGPRYTPLRTAIAAD